MLAALRQQLAAGLLTQVLQQIQLLIELFGSAAGSCFRDFFQPLAAMAGVVDVPAGTRNRPTAIESFQAIHDTGKIFDDGQITSCQLAQHAYATLTVVNGIEIVPT